MNNWKSGIVSDLCSNKMNCLYGCFCPACAIATAKTNFDESNWMFNLFCFGLSANQCILRSYIRKGYEIDGNHMSDCFYSSCCFHFSTIQLLNEVNTRGVRIRYNNVHNEITENYEKIIEHTPVCFDSISKNIDCVCVCVNMNCETASLYSNFTGYPLWFSYLSNINICQFNHIVRKEYNIGGDELKQDIIVPVLYSYTTIETIRALLVSKDKTDILPSLGVQWNNDETANKSSTIDSSVNLIDNFRTL